MTRRLRVAAAATLLALLVSACGSDAPDDAGAAAGPFSYTSGNGQVVKLDKRPERIIAHAYSAAALMEFGIRPVAVWADNPIKSDVGLRNVDFTGIEVIGETWGKIDVERAAALRPDLIVGDWWPAEKAYSGLEGGVEERSKKIGTLAPVVGPAQGDSIVDLIEGYERLAESLGADTGTGAAAAAKANFERARAAFTAAAKAKPGLTALAISPYEDKYAVAVPRYAPELRDFQSWGLAVIDPRRPDPSFPYWETLSFEQADTYQPDLLLFDDRNYPENFDLLRKQPIARSIKAFAAGAYVQWPAYWLHTYADYAKELDELTAAITKADPSLA
jgi:iron complex transport system substrate-binding protein